MQCIRPAGTQRYLNAVDGLVQLVRAEGVRGSLRGIGAMIGGAGPAHAAYFGCYEQIKKAVEQTSIQSTHLSPVVGGCFATLAHDSIMTPADGKTGRVGVCVCVSPTIVVFVDIWS